MNEDFATNLMLNIPGWSSDLPESHNSLIIRSMSASERLRHSLSLRESCWYSYGIRVLEHSIRYEPYVRRIYWAKET